MTPEQLQEMFTQASDKANVKAIFGEPQQVGEKVVIPVGKVSLAFGGGGGTSGADNNGGGTGSGGGFRVTAQPVGVLEITPERVTYQATADTKLLGLAGIAMAAWNVFWISLTIRQVARLRAREHSRPAGLPNPVQRLRHGPLARLRRRVRPGRLV